MPWHYFIRLRDGCAQRVGVFVVADDVLLDVIESMKACPEKHRQLKTFSGLTV